MYHLGQDLGGDWRWASYLIEYEHSGWLCDIGIFDIPEVNFLAAVFKLDVQRDLIGTHDISTGFSWISIFVFFLNFYAFLNEPGCSFMGARCPDDNMNCFHWISIFWYMYHLGQDLGGDWRWASYLIKYAHNGWLCDLGIFGIPEVNFLAGAFKLDT